MRPVCLALMAGCMILGWYVYAVLFRTTPGQDWMVFDTAGKAYLRGDTGLLLDGQRFTAVLNATHGWLAEPLRFHPWIYPPYTLLLALPFALLPWWASYGVFQAASFAGLVASLSLWARGTDRVLLIAGVACCAATAFTLGSGQNSFLSAGLVTAGIALMDRRPRAAGVLLGLLCFKPQLAFLVPLALAAAGAWRALAAAAATVCALLGLSLIAPGIGLWRAWLHLILGGDPAFHAWVEQGRLYGQSVFACARLAGLSGQAAAVAQAVAVLCGALCVAAAFRLCSRADRLAVLLLSMVLAAPHVGTYDAVLLGEASTMVLLGLGESQPGVGEAALAVAVWCSLSFQPPFVLRAAVATPLLVLALAVSVVRRAAQAAPGGPRASLTPKLPRQPV